MPNAATPARPTPRKAVCAGSFDPIHNGHLDIIHRARALFDEVIVAISTNPKKTYRFTTAERIAMIEESCAELPDKTGALGIVTVKEFSHGLIAEFCRDQGATALVKGIRNGTDLDYEAPMATFNRHLTGVETVLLPAEAQYQHVSSSLIKEISGLGGDISEFIPAAVQARL